MKLVTAGVAVAFALVASIAYGQDDKEALKRRILEAVEKKLKAEEERILKEIEKVIDEEIAKSKGVKPSKTDPKPDVTPPVKPKARGFLGIVPADLSEDELKDLGIKGGVGVGSVNEGSPAEKGGLQEGDVIMAVDGAAVAQPAALPGIIQKKGAGTTVTMKILRDKKELELKVTLGRHPDDPGEDPKVDPPKKDDAPKKDEPKAADPKAEADLRERIKKFMDKEKKDEPKAVEPEGGLSFEEPIVEKLRGALEIFGADIDDYLEKGKDGKWRLRREYSEKFAGLSPSELLKKITGDAATKKDAPKAEPKPEPAKKVATPWLGVMPEELTDDVRAQLDIEDGVGLAVAETRDGSPAAKSLKKGDIIVKIDGKPLKGEEGLRKYMATAKVGQELTLTVLRKGKSETVKLTLVERKD